MRVRLDATRRVRRETTRRREASRLRFEVTCLVRRDASRLRFEVTRLILRDACRLRFEAVPFFRDPTRFREATRLTRLERVRNPARNFDFLRLVLRIPVPVEQLRCRQSEGTEHSR